MCYCHEKVGAIVLTNILKNTSNQICPTRWRIANRSARPSTSRITVAVLRRCTTLRRHSLNALLSRHISASINISELRLMVSKCFHIFLIKVISFQDAKIYGVTKCLSWTNDKKKVYHFFRFCILCCSRLQSM